MQAAAFKDKQQEAPANNKGADDPDYENITLTFRKQDKARGRHSPPKSEARSRPSSDSAQGSPGLYRAIVTLYILLALLSIVLLAWILVKNSEMSREMLFLKMELSNVSHSALECQEGQKEGWSNIQQSISEVRTYIGKVKSDVYHGNEKLKMLPADIIQIKSQLQKISEMLHKMPSQAPPSK